MKARFVLTTLLAAATIAGQSVAHAAPPPGFWESMVNEKSADRPGAPQGDIPAPPECGPTPGAGMSMERHGHDMMRGPHDFHALLARLLGLTGDQKAKIAAILKEERDQTRPLMEKKFRSHEELRKIENAAAPDEKALRAAAGDLSKVETELIVSRVMTNTRILAVLSPSQRELLDRLDPGTEERPGPDR